MEMIQFLQSLSVTMVWQKAQCIIIAHEFAHKTLVKVVVSSNSRQKTNDTENDELRSAPYDSTSTESIIRQLALMEKRELSVMKMIATMAKMVHIVRVLCQETMRQFPNNLIVHNKVYSRECNAIQLMVNAIGHIRHLNKRTKLNDLFQRKMRNMCEIFCSAMKDHVNHINVKREEWESNRPPQDPEVTPKMTQFPLFGSKQIRSEVLKAIDDAAMEATWETLSENPSPSVSTLKRPQVLSPTPKKYVPLEQDDRSLTDSLSDFSLIESSPHQKHWRNSISALLDDEEVVQFSPKTKKATLSPTLEERVNELDQTFIDEREVSVKDVVDTTVEIPSYMPRLKSALNRPLPPHLLNRSQLPVKKQESVSGAFQMSIQLNPDGKTLSIKPTEQPPISATNVVKHKRIVVRRKSVDEKRSRSQEPVRSVVPTNLDSDTKTEPISPPKPPTKQPGLFFRKRFIPSKIFGHKISSTWDSSDV